MAACLRKVKRETVSPLGGVASCLGNPNPPPPRPKKGARGPTACSGIHRRPLEGLPWLMALVLPLAKVFCWTSHPTCQVEPGWFHGRKTLQEHHHRPPHPVSQCACTGKTALGGSNSPCSTNGSLWRTSALGLCAGTCHAGRRNTGACSGRPLTRNHPE